MKKLIFAAVALLFAACTTEQTADIMPSASKVLTVSFEKESRIQLNGEQKAVWTKDDLVSVFYNSDANQQWKFEGDTGATTATLVNVTEPASTKELSKVVAIYPYNEGYTISEDCKVTTTLPIEQSYLADSYGLNGNIMISYSEGDILKMRSVLGWLKLQLTGEGEIVKSITLTGNDSEQIAGGVVIDPSDLSLKLNDPTSTTLTLNCGEGVTLSEDVTTFYIGITPQTFERGFTVVAECADGSSMTKSTKNEVVIARNTIQPMDALEYQSNVPYNQIWYTSSDGEVVTPYETDVFGANIVSNTYENGQGIITFDGEVTSIGNYAFRGCSSLTSVTIPNSVTSIGEYAFIDCSSLTSVTIPDSVTSIGDYAFYYCRSLTSVTIGNSVTSIGEHAFYDCSKLSSVTIGNSVTSIGDDAFMYCSNITSVTIPDSVTAIGDDAFMYCSNIKDVYYQGDLSGWCKISFSDNPLSYGAKLYIDNKEVTDITIPSDITSIGNCTFKGCSSLTSVTIPDSVTEIGNYAFNNCDRLTSITIPDSVTEIGNYAFYGCSRLASITIPNSIISIGKWAFYYCSSLKSVHCKPTTPPVADFGGYSSWDAFYRNASGRKIYVPRASESAYEAARGWSSYAADIEPYDF